MPNKDGTGPNGKGPKTGRKKGNCKETKEKIKGTIKPKKGISYYFNKLFFFLYKKKKCKKCEH